MVMLRERVQPAGDLLDHAHHLTGDELGVDHFHDGRVVRNHLGVDE